MQISLDPLPRPEHAALLLVDHQVGTMGRDYRLLDPLVLRHGVLSLADAARARDVPTILTAFEPGGLRGPVLADLVARVPGEPCIVRAERDPWQAPAVREAIRRHGRPWLIIAGAPEVGLPALGAQVAAAGHGVVLVIDAPAAVAPLVVPDGRACAPAGAATGPLAITLASVLVAAWADERGAPRVPAAGEAPPARPAGAAWAMRERPDGAVPRA